VRNSSVVGLSPIEQKVMKLLANGKTTAEISALLHKSVRTIDGHIYRIAKRMELSSVREVRVISQQLFADRGVPELDLSRLTNRQLEILMNLSDGLNYPQIAERLGIKPITVYATIRQVKDRLGVDTLEMLAAAARKAVCGSGFLQTPRSDSQPQGATVMSEIF
jgi:DNA-binding CsgD family transcriptional regulator